MQKSAHHFYSETFKLEVLRDYYCSGMLLNSTVSKWGLSRCALLLSWITRYPIDSELLSLDITIISECRMSKAEKHEEDARDKIGEMIHFYNHQISHMSIGMKKPMEVYQGQVPGENLWKKK